MATAIKYAGQILFSILVIGHKLACPLIKQEELNNEPTTQEHVL
jgi:hypothetical protein